MLRNSLKTLADIRSLRHVLPAVVAVLTQHNRYQPEIKWSENLWAHNIFRLYEIVFGRRVGIRCESAQWQNKDGSKHRLAFTLEARCAFVEADIRAFLKRLASIRVYVLQPVATLGVFDPRLFPYAFAIAAQAYSKGATQTASPHSFSVTVVGSNTFLITCAFRPANATTPTSVVFNTSENATKSTTDTSTPNTGGYYGAELWYLAGASATTANNVLTFTGGGNAFQYCLQYTGVTDPGITLATPGEVAYASTTCHRSHTPTVANGWGAWFGSGDGSQPTGVSDSFGTMRSTVPSSDWCAADSGATMAASAQTLGYTNSSGTKGTISFLGFGASAAAPASNAIMIGHFA